MLGLRTPRALQWLRPCYAGMYLAVFQRSIADPGTVESWCSFHMEASHRTDWSRDGEGTSSVLVSCCFYQPRSASSLLQLHADTIWPNPTECRITAVVRLENQLLGRSPLLLKPVLSLLISCTDFLHSTLICDCKRSPYCFSSSLGHMHLITDIELRWIGFNSAALYPRKCAQQSLARIITESNFRMSLRLEQMSKTLNDLEQLKITGNWK